MNSPFRCARPLVRLFLASFTATLALPAQDTVVQADWRQAEKFSPSNLRPFVYATSVTPTWIGKTESFWYSFKTSDGTSFWLVDAEQRTKKPLFDHNSLATALSVATRKPQVGSLLALGGLKVDDTAEKLEFTNEGRRFEYQLSAGTLTDKGPAPSQPATREAGEQSTLGRGERQEQRQEQQEQQRELQQEQRQEQQQEQQQEQRQQQQQEQQQDQQQEQRQTGRGGRDGRGDGGRPARGRGDLRLFSPDRQTYAIVRDHEIYVVEGVAEDDEQIEPAAAVPATGPATVAEATEAAGTVGDQSLSGEAGAAAAAGAPKQPRFTFDHSPAVKLSEGSGDKYSFGSSGGPTGRGTGERAEATNSSTPNNPSPVMRANATWSKDSLAFFATRRDARGVKDLFLVNSLGEPRPTLETYGYSMPGEATAAHSELWRFDREQKQLRRVPSKWTQESYQNVHFFGDGNELRFVRRDRLHRNLELCAVDASNKERVLLSESIEGATLAVQNVRYLDKRKQLVWWSERSGWGHFYLHDANSGALIHAITSGTFRASRIVQVDEEGGVLWFQGNGREANENIYHEHLYRVNLDGTDLVCLDPGDASHRSTLSPSRRHLVDTYSRVDLAPRAVLRSARDGSVLLDIEVTDLSRLEEKGWKMPDRFTVKAADGVTDLYGNLWKPFDFDPQRRYPVIVNVYPGPQQEGVTHTFSATASTQQLAQLGFVVIQVGHRGGTPNRDKAYGAYGFGNLRDYGLEDKKAAIEQLADRFSFVDITRVGIYGHSGGGFMTAAALLKPPYNRFFKVGVASAGNHDNNIYNASWSERWHGLTEKAATTEKAAATTTTGGTGAGGTQTGSTQTQNTQATRTVDSTEQRRGQRGRGRTGDNGQRTDGERAGTEASAAQSPFEIKVPTNAELAENLEGKLLLVHGEIDNNVHPANTMRLVDALIKANKRFDMLVIPGARHAFGVAGEYLKQRMYEYFAEHLLGDRERGADITRKDG